jgi:hypothetical protein
MDETENRSVEQQVESQATGQSGDGRPVGHRLRDAVKNHPMTLLAGAAVVAAVAGVELAAGALIGLGAAALLGTDDGRVFRQKIFGQGRSLFRRRPSQSPAAVAT